MGRKEERRKGDGKRGGMKGRREGRRKGEEERERADRENAPQRYRRI